MGTNDILIGEYMKCANFQYFHVSKSLSAKTGTWILFILIMNKSQL